MLQLLHKYLESRHDACRVKTLGVLSVRLITMQKNEAIHKNCESNESEKMKWGLEIISPVRHRLKTNSNENLRATDATFKPNC